MKHLPAIDGLRAFAVLAVVAYHAGLPLSAGYVGVDVFFVISGYVITRMLLSEPRIDLAAFYARRVRRILPALVVVVAATLALSAAMLGPEARGDVTRSAMASAAMVPNLRFQFATGGYFDSASDEMPLLHLWSLGVEEQFYLVWPLLLIAFRRRPWLIAALAVASLALAMHWMGEVATREHAFYQMPARFWELAAGGFVAMLPKSRLGTITATLGLGAVLYATVNSAESFPGLGAAMPVFGTALVLHAIHSGTRILPLELAPVRYVGLISYSLYLWHWPLLAIARARAFEPPSIETNLALCALAFVLAALTYHFVETPFRRTNAPNVRAIALGVFACVGLAGCAAAVGATSRDDLSERTARDFDFSVHVACHQQMDDAPRLPSPAACGDGDVVLWGDSHAFMWRAYADTYGKVYQMTRAACAPSASVGARGGCAEFNVLAVERAKRGKIVVLAARWNALNTGDAYIESALDALANVPRVVVMGPLPELPHAPQKCIAKRRTDLCTLSRVEFDRQTAPQRAALRAAVLRHPNAVLIEPTDYFCNSQECPLLKDGRSLYWDNNHITTSAAVGFSRNEGVAVRR